MERFIVCKASAGSGKTYTLVRQFIETAISSPSNLQHRFEHILAITFTNKAANGMKERIMSQLYKVVCGEGSSLPLVKEMAGHLGITEAETVSRCKVLQESILHHYSYLSVCTIDSFVHRLVRTFAHDLRLPMNFNVQIEKQDIIQSAVDELMSLAGKEEESALTRVLCSFTESRMEEGASYNLERDIAELAKQIFEEETPQYLSQLEDIGLEEFVDIHKRLYDANRRFEEQVKTHAESFLEACRRNGVSKEDFPYTGSGTYSVFAKLADGEMDLLNKERSRADKAYDTGVLYAKSASADTKARLESVTQDFLRCYGALTDLAERELRLYNTRRALLSNLFGLALLERINAIKNEYYKANDIVHISEFNKRIADEIVDQPTPFIYERIGSRYNNYMIDEFQDTSRLQWLNFLPLLDEAMSHGFSRDTALPGMQSLVVGDGKQAIYRFRQGDVRQFVRLPEVDNPLHGQSLKHYARVDNLKHNFRTMSNIVEFNNSFFTEVVSGPFAGNDDLVRLYLGSSFDPSRPVETADLTQLPVKEGGYVEVSFCQKEEVFERVLAAIRHQTGDLGFDYGDIMVLARDNKTLSKLADYLIANSGDDPIPIFSAESFLLRNSRVVLFLLSLLKYLYDSKDRQAAVDALRLADELQLLPTATVQNSKFKIQNSKFNKEWLLRDKGFDLRALMADYGYDIRLEYLKSLSLYDCCEQLIRIFRLGGRDTAYVSTLLGVVSNHEQRSNSGLRGLIDYLESGLDKLSSKTASDMHAVQLLTIHKAKGLEAKIVICVQFPETTHDIHLWVDATDSRQPMANSQQPTADSQQPTADSQQPTANGQQPTANGQQPKSLPVAFVGVKKECSTMFDPAFEEERRLREMDRVNILYVALTRPEQKLLVVCEDKTSKERMDNIALLQDYCRRHGMQKDIFTIGEDFQSTEQKHSNTQTLKHSSVQTIANASFPAWEDRIGIAEQNESLLSTVVDYVQQPSANGQQPIANPRRYGIMLHEMLSHIISFDDVDSVVDEFCRRTGNVSPTDEAGIKSRIKSMIERDGNSRFFDSRHRVVCEASIVVDGSVCRPDRIVFAEDETWVVDFKTGVRNDETHKQYEQQVARYAEVLTDMGYPDVKPVILYL